MVQDFQSNDSLKSTDNSDRNKSWKYFYILPSLHRLADVGAGQHVDVVSQLGQGGEDEDHRGEDHHSHGGEGVELKI